MSIRMNKALVYCLFIAAVLAGGILIGINTPPGDWYQALVKPAFNPPNWIFAPVWSALYVMIGIAGARTFLYHRGTGAMRLWGAQLVFNFAWSPVFFGLNEIALALIVILALLVSIGCFIAAAWNRDRVSSVLFLPYLAWVLFATALNASIFALN